MLTKMCLLNIFKKGGGGGPLSESLLAFQFIGQLRHFFSTFSSAQENIGGRTVCTYLQKESTFRNYNFITSRIGGGAEI